MPLFKISHNYRLNLVVLTCLSGKKFKGETTNRVVTAWINAKEKNITDNMVGYSVPTCMTDIQLINHFILQGYKMPLGVIGTTPVQLLETILANAVKPNYAEAEATVLKVFEITSETLARLYDQSN